MIEPQHKPKKRAFMIILIALAVFTLLCLLTAKLGFIKQFLLVCAAILLIHIVNGLTYGRNIEYKVVEYSSKKLPKALDGYKIAFVTDTHDVSEKDLKKIVEQINQEDADLLLLGGDYAPGEKAVKTIEILARSKTKDGIFGIEGNHDYFEMTFAAMRNEGIIPLENEGIKLRDGLFLGGVEDLWNRNPDLQKATKGAATDDFILILSHNPDVAMQQEEVTFDLMLSGHTHAGQVTFFGVFAPAMFDISSYGQRFMKGFCKGAAKRDVFVSRGVGSGGNIPRIFARPQLVILSLKSV